MKSYSKCIVGPAARHFIWLIVRCKYVKSKPVHLVVSLGFHLVYRWDVVVSIRSTTQWQLPVYVIWYRLFLNHIFFFFYNFATFTFILQRQGLIVKAYIWVFGTGEPKMKRLSMKWHIIPVGKDGKYDTHKRWYAFIWIKFFKS